MKTIAENSNDFAELRTLDRGNCVYVDKTDYDWKVHPVIHLDFSLGACRTHAEFMTEMPAVVKTAINKTGYAHGAKEGRAYEMSFERMLKILFWAQGLEVITEDVQSQGRADMVVKARRAIYIIELKRDETAAAALAQIHEKDYAAPYRARNLPIWAIGLNFDSKTRQLTDAVHERLG